jgi:hypothetical protein
VNKKEIQSSFFYIRRNDKRINRGKLEVLKKISKNEILVKFKFFNEDTIYKTDTLYVNFNSMPHYITGTKEVCVETIGTPFIKVYNIDGVQFVDGEGSLEN